MKCFLTHNKFRRKLVPCVSFLMAAATLSGCMKGSPEEVIGCDPPQSNLPFQVVDKSSGENLFFSANPKYQPEDMKIYKIQDKDRKSPVQFSVTGTADKRMLLLPYKFSNPKDTMILKIADSPDDMFIYSVKRSENPCLPDQLIAASFNNTALIFDNNPLIFKK